MIGLTDVKRKTGKGWVDLYRRPGGDSITLRRYHGHQHSASAESQATNDNSTIPRLRVTVHCTGGIYRIYIG